MQDRAMGKGGAKRRTREAEAASAVARRLGLDPWAITPKSKCTLLPSYSYQSVYPEGRYLMRRPPPNQLSYDALGHQLPNAKVVPDLCLP